MKAGRGGSALGPVAPSGCSWGSRLAPPPCGRTLITSGNCFILFPQGP